MSKLTASVGPLLAPLVVWKARVDERAEQNRAEQVKVTDVAGNRHRLRGQLDALLDPGRQPICPASSTSRRALVALGSSPSVATSCSMTAS